MPRRAPCASTKQARIRGGTCKRPETCRVTATVTMTGSAFEGSIRRTPNENDSCFRSTVDKSHVGARSQVSRNLVLHPSWLILEGEIFVNRSVPQREAILGQCTSVFVRNDETRTAIGVDDLRRCVCFKHRLEKKPLRGG